MVVKMKRLELLLYHRERERFLIELKKLGVVHIIEEEQVAESPDVQQLGDAVRRAQRIESLLKKRAKEQRPSSALQKTIYTPETLLDWFEKIEERIEQGNQEIAALQKDIAALEPWGNFDPAMMKKLQKAGIRIKFFITEEKEFASIDRTTITIEEIARIKNQVYFVAIEHGESIAAPQAEEVRLPEASLEALRKSVLDREKELAACRREIEALSRHIDALSSYVQEKQEALTYERAKLSMSEQADGSVMYLSGWLPLKQEKSVAQLLQNFTVWFKIRDAQAGDSIPIKIQNGPFARLFEPIMKIFSLPDYFELDPTPFFTPFFVGFVGLCVGDLGYGSLVLIGSLVALWKAPRAYKPFAAMAAVLGVSAICAGVLLNSIFGHALFGGTIAFLGPVEQGKGTVYPAMSFAIFVGILQVTFGICLQIVNKFRNDGLKGGAQPFGYLLMIIGGLTWMAQTNFQNLNMSHMQISAFNVGKLFILIPTMPALALFFTGVVLHMCFNNISSPLMQRLFDPTKGFLELYFFISGFLGYVLSYLRLFAVGLSGGLLGSSITYIAFMLISKDGKPDYHSPLIVVTIPVLIVGHILNCAISLIGSFVHPLRLTFVEFYSNLGFKGGGKAYKPFAGLQEQYDRSSNK